jgi:hypothetical protein
MTNGESAEYQWVWTDSRRWRSVAPRRGERIARRVDAYTAGGVASGLVVRAAHVRDALEGEPALILERVSWRSLDAPAARPAGEVAIPIDDVLLVLADDDPPLLVHHAWHAVRLELGPYAVQGDLPTLPGFDPGRALTRPSGEFVMLRDVRVRRVDDPEGEPVVGAYALVNRYTVERVEADIMLGFFFPGAVMVVATESEGGDPATSHLAGPAPASEAAAS